MSPVERMCLDRIKKGLIRFDSHGRVEYFHLVYRRWMTRKPSLHNKSGRGRYVLQCKGKSATVYANRLHWMITYKKPIPNTHFVDHKDENLLNDHPDNLMLMRVGESHSQGQRIHIDNALDRLLRWFKFVGENLREPRTEHEVLLVNTGF